MASNLRIMLLIGAEVQGTPAAIKLAELLHVYLKARGVAQLCSLPSALLAARWPVNEPHCVDVKNSSLSIDSFMAFVALETQRHHSVRACNRLEPKLTNWLPYR